MYTFLLLCLALFWMIRAGWQGKVQGPLWSYWLNIVASVVVTSVVTRQSWDQAIRLTANMTSLEVLKGTWKGKKNPYDRGNCLENWEEVCGSKKFLPLWLCPIPLAGGSDGFNYGVGGEVESTPFLHL
jgi:hypothetical protein